MQAEIVEINRDEGKVICRGIDPTGRGREYPLHAITRMHQEIKGCNGSVILTRLQYPFKFQDGMTMQSVAGLTFGQDVVGIIDNTRTIPENAMYIAIGRFADPKSIYLVHPIDIIQGKSNKQVINGFPFFDVHSVKGSINFNKGVVEKAEHDIIFQASSLPDAAYAK
jgi:hypothetical protein